MEMTTDPPIKLCHWLIQHGEHPAWYQRAVMVGDFAPGRVPLVNYVTTLEGVELGPEVGRPICGSCGEAPLTDALNVVERSTGFDGWLADFRSRRALWPVGTDSTTCWYCNSPQKTFTSARLVFASPASPKVLLCSDCVKKVGVA